MATLDVLMNRVKPAMHEIILIDKVKDIIMVNVTFTWGGLDMRIIVLHTQSCMKVICGLRQVAMASTLRPQFSHFKPLFQC